MLKWFRQIDNSGSAGEVIATARDYFATWTPAELALLPPACRPGRMRDPDDLAQLHSSLVEEYRTTKATGEPLKRLQEMTSFVVRAAIRLAELAPDGDDATRKTGDPGDGATRSASPRNWRDR